MRTLPSPGCLLHSRIAILGAAVALCVAAGWSAPARALPCPPAGCDGPTVPLAELTDERAGHAEAFRLMLGSSLEQTSQSVPLRIEQRLEARQTRYVHAAFTRAGGDPVSTAQTMSAPSGLEVLGADLFFTGRDELIETSMLLESDTTAEAAIDELERRWGPADFELVLPGSLSLVIGWRGPSSYALATFSDLPVFELSIFEDRPEDLLAGTQIVLFEGLQRCSDQLDAGHSPDDVLPQLMEIVRWVENARQVIRPR